MQRRKVSVRDKQIRRLEYTCPRCHSDNIVTNDRVCSKIYSCAKICGSLSVDNYKVCQGCRDFISDNQVTLRLKCLDCLYEWTILSKL